MGNFAVEKQKIKNAISENVYEMLKEAKCVLAGGAITSLMTGREVNDYDLYFTSRESVDLIVGNIFGVTEDEWIDNFDLTANHVTERSFLTKDRKTTSELQFIHYKMYNSAEEIFKSFDFQVCMGAYDFATEEFIFHESFFKDNSQRVLKVNSGTDFPIVSVLRTEKYHEKGYKISKAQLLVLMLCVVNKTYSSWEDVISEVGGLYGINPEELFDTSKPFSIPEVIAQLEKITVLEEKPYVVREYTFDQVLTTMRNAFTDNFRNWYDDLVNDDKSYWTKLDDAQNNKFDSKITYLTKPKTSVQSDDKLDNLLF